jgi:hypothetical protein
MLHKDCNCKCSVEKNTSRESQGACSQDELIGGKTASRKVTLTLNQLNRLSELGVAVVKSGKLVAEIEEGSGTKVKGNVHLWKPLPRNGQFKTEKTLCVL